MIFFQSRPSLPDFELCIASILQANFIGHETWVKYHIKIFNQTDLF